MSSVVRFKSKVCKLEHLSGHYLDVPPDVIKELGGISKQRWVCTVGGVSWQCGVVALAGGRGYIILNQILIKKIGLKPGQVVAVTLSKDKSKFGLDVPEELEEIFKQDREGKKRFEALVPGKRRYIIYYVRQVKGTNLRLERAVRLITNLKELPKGKETFAGILRKRL